MKAQTKPYRYTLVLWLGLCVYAISPNFGGFWVKLFALALGLGLYAGSIFAVTELIRSHDTRKDTVAGLRALYIDTILLFSVAYLIVYYLSPNGEFVKGLHVPCWDSGMCPNAGSLDKIVDFFMAWLDSAYYSIVTMTTLGDGSVVVNGWARFLVASQVLFTFYVSVFSLAEAFSKESAKVTEEIVKRHVSRNLANGSRDIGAIRGFKSRFRVAWSAMVHGVRV